MRNKGVESLVELLAPAGTKEAFYAAVENGANAVYLAGKMFGARAYAANFDEQELSDVIRYAHLKNVQVHVAVNTIIDNEELPKLKEYLSFLSSVGADAVLVQDLGAARLAQQIAPSLPLHASTQMTIHNSAGVKALAALGFSRVVLARELSIPEIQKICRESSVEIECFVHGALCVCYSGQCLMSSMIGGRSGNRGRCAQPCRLPYTLIDAAGRDVLGDSAGNFLLSPRDLNAVDLIPQLLDAGIYSLKIEGRMKRPEYVATIVRTYRKAIDHYLAAKKPPIDDDDRDHLAQVFNRDFTTAYMERHQGKQMMSDRRPNNRGLLVGRVVDYDARTEMVSLKLARDLAVGDQLDFWVKVGGRVSAEIEHLYDEDGRECLAASAGDIVSFRIRGRVRMHDRAFKVYDAKLMETARRSYAADSLAKIPVAMHLHAKLQAPLTLHVEDDAGNCVDEKSEYLPVRATKRPLTDEIAKAQMERLGTTAFVMKELTCEIDPEVMVPVSELNKLRRAAIAALEEIRLSRFQAKKEICRVMVPVRENVSTAPPAKLMVSVDSLAAAEAAISGGADGILYGGESYEGRHLQPRDYDAVWDYAQAHHVRIDYNTPRIVHEGECSALVDLLAHFENKLPAALHVHNIGTAQLAQEHCSAALHADASMISYNRATLDFLQSYGFQEATISPELNEKQAARLAHDSTIPLSMMVSGRLPLMVSEYCVLGSFLGNLDKGKCTMPCRKGRYFLHDRKGIDFPIVTDQFCRMHILNSKKLSLLPHVPKILRAGITTLRIEGRGTAPDELQRTVSAYRDAMKLSLPLTEEEEKRLQMQEGNDITRGHYFRGIL